MSSYEASSEVAKRGFVNIHVTDGFMLIYLPKFITENQKKWFKNHMKALSKFILAVSNIILIISYAPADTTKRPIISKNFRKFYKIMSLLVAITFNILSFCIKDTFLSNSLLLSILTEAIMICPFTYKLFKVPYNNYLNFNFEA